MAATFALMLALLCRIDYLPDEGHVLRSEQDVTRSASQAIRLNRPVHGVKGVSVFTPYLNIVKDIPIDYMHAVLEGVTRTLLCKMWMDGRHRNLRFYLLQSVKQIDELLLAIKPPHEFRRSPRCIQTTVKKLESFRTSFFLALLCNSCVNGISSSRLYSPLKSASEINPYSFE